MRVLAVLSVILAILLASDAIGAPPDKPVSNEKIKIVLGTLALAPTWGVTIVTGANLWKTYLPNVELERVEATSGMPLVNNILAGKVDIAYLGDMPAIVLGSKRDVAQSKFVAATEADRGGSAVIYVKKGSSITSVKELDGKRVSISFGAYTHRFAELVAENEKIKFNLVGQSPEVGLTSLQTGKVDAYITWPPYGPLAVERGFGRVLMDGTKLAFGSVRCIVVSKEFAEKHPDVLVGWLRAELDAHKILRERPKYAAKLIYDDWRKYEIPMSIITDGFKYKSFPDDIGPEWRKVMVDGAEFLFKNKLINQMPDFASFTDESFLKKAAEIPSHLDLSKIAN